VIRERVYGFNESRILRIVIGNYLNPARERYIWHRSSSVLDDFRTTTPIQQHHCLGTLHYYRFLSSPLSTSIILLYTPFTFTSFTMHTILDVIHATNSVSKQIADAHANGVDGPQLTPKEQAESIIAKSRVGNFPSI
jgi:hypothetical protein